MFNPSEFKINVVLNRIIPKKLKLGVQKKDVHKRKYIIFNEAINADNLERGFKEDASLLIPFISKNNFYSQETNFVLHTKITDINESDNHTDLWNDVDKFNNTYLASKARIKSFKEIGENWDSMGSAAPSELSIRNALFALELLKDSMIFPNSINPSSDEGIVFEFSLNKNYFIFEFYNDGDIVFLKDIKDGSVSEPMAFDISSSEIKEKIREINTID